MKNLLFVLFVASLLVRCGAKKKPEVPEANFFPVVPYLKGEVARLDTSLSSFLKIETANGRSDTVPIKSTEVRRYAVDFLSLPDISNPELKNDYEITHLYDDMLDAFVFTFTTKEPHPVKREDVVLESNPEDASKNTVKSIFVERWDAEGNKAVRKNMFWEAGKSFHVTTTSTSAADSPSTKRLQVVWNRF